MEGAGDGVERGWPVLALRLNVGETTLRHVRERDLPHLAAILPDDFEHDPGIEPFPGHGLAEHRQRILFQGYWRSVGNWSPASWCLDFAVEHQGEVVGVQSVKAENFLAVRTVDSNSWLATTVRRRGLGVAMRRAVLALAFDPLGAHWCTILWSAGPDDLLMHPWSPPGHRHRGSTFEVQHEFCGVRWPRTPRPATGLCAGERRSVSDRLRCPGTTGWLPTAATVRKPR